MTDRYAVVGNPVAHSKSPAIHAAFAAATAQSLTYGRVEAPLDGFATTIARLRGEGYAGCNVTVPFKEEAFALATELTPRAREAGAVNTLKFSGDTVLGDNTDGAGLVADVLRLLGGEGLRGLHVCIAGAGGATRGVVGPLLRAGVASLTIANRTVAKAQAIVASFAHAFPHQPLRAVGYTDLDDAPLEPAKFDLIINATSASLGGQAVPVPARAFAHARLAYDMMYGKGDTPFMLAAREGGAAQVADGLGMLVEQAAEAFLLWRGANITTRSDTASVMALLRG